MHFLHFFLFCIVLDSAYSTAIRPRAPSHKPPTAEAIISHLHLIPHPEGGFYNETYRSTTTVSTPSGPRSASTAILFLLTQNTFSALHRLRSDEIWHWHAGAPIRITSISPAGKVREEVCGGDVLAGESPQVVVRAGDWFGAEVVGDRKREKGRKGADWGLVGCTVAPGFEFEDFELGEREELIRLFPQHEEVVERLTRV